MGFFDEMLGGSSENFDEKARRFANGRKPSILLNENDEHGNSNKRAEFKDGSFIEEIRNGDEVSQIALNLKPHNHKPPKVKNPDDEPMDFFNF